MPCRNLSLILIVVFVSGVSFAEDAESVYQEGVAKLRLAQADHAQLVPATKLLAKAAALFEAAAKEIPVTEAEAMLKKADAFAQGHADDALLISIRYYEIADRFPDAPE